MSRTAKTDHAEGTPKAKKNGNNEGSIRKRKKGQYEARITLGVDSEVKPKRQSFYGKSRQEAFDKMALALTQVRAGTFTEPNQVTVRQWLENWMEVYQANTITPNFYVRRLDLIKLHINPTLGDKQLMKLRPADIKALYNRLEKNGKVDGSGGLSSQSIRHIHNILNPTMKQAVKEGLIAKNMVADVRPPKLVRTKEARPLDKEEASRYLKQIANHRLYAAFLLELTTGLRRGELLGVQWGDLNPDTGALKIRRQVSRVKLPGNPSTLEYAPLKTPSSYRTIMLPAITLKALESHRKQQNEEKMRWRTIYQDEDLIFCTPLGGKLDTRHPPYRIP